MIELTLANGARKGTKFLLAAEKIVLIFPEDYGSEILLDPWQETGVCVTETPAEINRLCAA